MDANDRKGALRRPADVELDQPENERSELSALRRRLLEPIEDNRRRAADESAVLLAHAGRSWGA
jgi:hypothetical protein